MGCRSRALEPGHQEVTYCVLADVAFFTPAVMRMMAPPHSKSGPNKHSYTRVTISQASEFAKRKLGEGGRQGGNGSSG